VLYSGGFFIFVFSDGFFWNIFFIRQEAFYRGKDANNYICVYIDIGRRLGRNFGKGADAGVMKLNWLTEKKFHCRLIFSAFLSLFLLFQNGCSAWAGLVGVLGTDRRSERRVPAEYELKPDKTDKERTILVFVEQIGQLGARENLRLFVTDAVNKALEKRVKISPEFIIEYPKLSDFRSGRGDFTLFSPDQLGRELGADLVLLISLQGYRLERVAESDYFKGLLMAHASLWDVTTGRKLWPDSEKSRGIIVGFDAHTGRRDLAAKRLSSALAHCVTRYFYDCKEENFKIGEDLSGEGWKDWER